MKYYCLSIFFWLFVAYFVSFLISCAGIPAQPEVPTKVVILPKMQALAWSNPEWDSVLAAAVESDLTRFEGASEHMNKICPGYARADKALRIHTWSTLVVAIAKRESGYNPKATYYECSSKQGTYSSERYVEGRGYCMRGGTAAEDHLVISRGLFQTSFSSSNSYGCGLKEPKDLHDPKLAIQCAVKILGRWLAADKVITGGKLGCGRYWSVCRPGHHDKEILAKVSALPFCAP